jgi:hypothetical protein
LKCIKAITRISKQDWMVLDKTETHMHMWFCFFGREIGLHAGFVIGTVRFIVNRKTIRGILIGIVAQDYHFRFH